MGGLPQIMRKLGEVLMMIHIVAKDIPFRSTARLAGKVIYFFVNGMENMEEAKVPILVD